jgi:hypothetical protein
LKYVKGSIAPNDIMEGQSETMSSKKEDSNERNSKGSPDKGESEKDNSKEEEDSKRHGIEENNMSRDSDKSIWWTVSYQTHL